MAPAASTSGAIKQFLEAQGLGISVYRDRAPQGAAPPYVTVSEAVAITPDVLEDGAASTVREEVTVDVWMPWRTSTGGIAESYTLPGAVAKALQGQALPAAPTRAYAVIVHRVGPRLPDEEENVVHVPIQADVWRAL